MTIRFQVRRVDEDRCRDAATPTRRVVDAHMAAAVTPIGMTHHRISGSPTANGTST